MSTLYFWMLFTGICIVLGICGLVTAIKVDKDYCIAPGVIGAGAAIVALVIFLSAIIDPTVPMNPINIKWWSLYLFPVMYLIWIVVIFCKEFTNIFNISDWYESRYWTCMKELTIAQDRIKELENEIHILKEQNTQETNRLKKKFFLRRMPKYIKLHIV